MKLPVLCSFADNLPSRGITPSVKNLSKFMQHPATLWYPEIIEELNELRRSLKQ